MKTNKKLKLNTKKVVILSNDQQDAIQGGGRTIGLACWGQTMPFTHCSADRTICYSTNINCPVEA